MGFIPEDLTIYPTLPGVYLMKNELGKILYIGKAKNLRVRLRSYFSLQDERAMIPFLLEQLAIVETIVTSSEKDALILENTLIKQHKPKYNILLKDDKSFAYIAINHKHQWPTVSLLRLKRKPPSNVLSFGPYTNSYAARQIVDLIQQLFPLRRCSDQVVSSVARPCILYGMKRCCAPCVGLVTKEQYQDHVQHAIGFLKGKDREIVKSLKEKMQKASDALEFEQAALFKQTLLQIEEVTKSSSVVEQSHDEECDVLGIYREGGEVVLMQLIVRHGRLCGSQHYSFSNILEENDEIFTSFLLQHYSHLENKPKKILLGQKLTEEEILTDLLKIQIIQPQKGGKKELVALAAENAKASFAQVKSRADMREKLLLDLQERCNLTRYPKRIECFDISHTGGTQIVASLVAFTDGEKDKARTRLYKLKETKAGDDYGAMREVLMRRLRRAKEEDDLPDLILVDGGKGQLGVAIKVLEELEIVTLDIASIVKENARHDKGMTQERLFLKGQELPIHLPATSPLLFLLQQIRDESHRIAITFHRKQRASHSIKSWLDGIPGIGPKKREALLRHFGSVAEIKKATKEQLLELPLITEKDAETLLSKPHIG